MTLLQARSRLPYYPPQLAADLLGVPKTTFRYWRESFEGGTPHRGYSSADILTYRCIKHLILGKSLTVHALLRCQLCSLFNWWPTITDYEAACQLWLIVDDQKFCWTILPRHSAIDPEAYLLYVLALEPVISEHTTSFYGHSKVFPGQHSFPHFNR